VRESAEREGAEVKTAKNPDLADDVGLDGRRAALTGRARRGAKPPAVPVFVIDDPALPQVLAELAAARADEMDADTVIRELAIAHKAISWWQRQGWITCDPTIGIERRPATPDRAKALAESQIAAPVAAGRVAAGEDAG
jgi:hypothetical protein